QVAAAVGEVGGDGVRRTALGGGKRCSAYLRRPRAGAADENGAADIVVQLVLELHRAGHGDTRRTSDRGRERHQLSIGRGRLRRDHRGGRGGRVNVLHQDRGGGADEVAGAVGVGGGKVVVAA